MTVHAYIFLVFMISVFLSFVFNIMMIISLAVIQFSSVLIVF